MKILFFTIALIAMSLPAKAQSVPVCREILSSGDFEYRGAWFSSPSTRPPAIIEDSSLAADGARFVRIGIVEQPNIATNSQIEQVVILPTNTTSIVFSYRYYTQYSKGIDSGDYQYAAIYDEATGMLAAPPLFQELRNDQVWLLGQFNLQQLAGMQLRIVFGVNNDGGSGAAGMLIDGVSIIACGSGISDSPRGEGCEIDESIFDIPTVTATPVILVPIKHVPEFSDTSYEGLNRLGTVAVLIGILAITMLLISAIVRMLRGH